MPNDILEKITKMLNERLTGYSCQEMYKVNLEEMVRHSAGYGEIIEQIVPELLNTLLYTDTMEVYHDGAANILSLPEYNDINKARSFFNILEEKQVLFDLLSETTSDINIKIGAENKIEQLKDCSLITATYRINGKTIGSVGVIGPTRMEYSKVISIVDCMTSNLSEILTKIIKK